MKKFIPINFKYFLNEPSCVQSQEQFIVVHCSAWHCSAMLCSVETFCADLSPPTPLTLIHLAPVTRLDCDTVTGQWQDLTVPKENSRKWGNTRMDLSFQMVKKNATYRIQLNISRSPDSSTNNENNHLFFVNFYGES